MLPTFAGTFKNKQPKTALLLQELSRTNNLPTFAGTFKNKQPKTVGTVTSISFFYFVFMSYFCGLIWIIMV
ncbi:hypothetical protein DCC39_18715 [Pueribacillus theae]|uniref:Uncharacterized protein n=1 Tax=Pueribacillus theae TaxID=2171751 RepID=A0A2U1JHQ9_9BACI|nr:hypothetical protein [Pueribacillus theae]PWA04676.1 hypothetical protein DCC39_18715 [Pueribacillus theae]